MKLTELGYSRRMMLLLIGLVAICSQACLASEESVKEKYISAIIYSKWSETPFLLETSEFIFRNNPSSFWPFVDAASQLSVFESDVVNNKTYYDQVVQLASRFVSPLQLDLLKLTLSIRTYSPTIEMSRKLAEEALKAGNVLSLCSAFVYVHGKCTCDLENIQNLIESADIEHKPFVYQFDKHYNAQSGKSVASSSRITIILYARIGSKEFKSFHDKIVSLVNANGQLDYILRHNYVPVEKTDQEETNKVGLSGYGVELDIKSTEYKAIDDSKVETSTTDSVGGQNLNKNSEKDIQGFMFDKLKDLHPDLKERLDEYRKHLLESTLELAPLKAWQMQDLSLQAAQRIMESPANEALSLLEDLSQNFPVLARALSAVNMKSETKKTLKMHRSALESRHSLEPGQGALFINGREVNIDTVDIFSLNSLLNRESRLIDGIHRIGMSLDHVKDLTYLDTSSKSNDYGVDIRDSSIQWLNDLENDKKYKHWPRNCQDILRPTYPGMMRSIAKNFFNLVLFVDPAKRESKELLKTAESFYVNDVPVRIGFVFVTSNKEEVNGADDASVALFRAHNYVKEKSGSAAKALSFLTDIYAKVTDKSANVKPEDVMNHFKKRFPKEKNLDDVFGPESYYDEGRKLTMDYYNKVGLKTLPQVLVNGFPLGENEIEADVFEESVLTKIMQLTQEIQMSVYRGFLTDSMNLMDWLMNKDNIMPRLNPLVLSQERQYIEIDESSLDFLSNIKYISSVKEPFHPLTIWVVADPDTEQGRQLLSDAIYFYDSSKESIRVALLMQKSTKSSDDIVKRTIAYALKNLNSAQAFTFVKRILKEKTYSELKSGKRSLNEIDFKDLDLDQSFADKIKEFDIDTVIREHQTFLQARTPFKSSDHRGLIVNGWVLGPFDDNETFLDSDFSLLENFISKIGLKQIKELINKWKSAGTLPSSDQSLDDKILRVCAIIGKYSSNEKRVRLPELATGVVKVSPRNDKAPHFDIALVIDPLTRQAQHISTILRVLHQTTNVNVQIYFNCKDKLSAAPLKSFYRYVLESDVRHDQSSGQLIRPYAYFHNMPQSPILTMNIHAPESWMVEASNSPYDLDNIRLQEIDSDGAYGEFELEHLIIEGHAFDVLSGQPPRGLQFILGTPAQPEIYDTIVMANLGYFQLKASPGIWILQLREGRSKDIYEIISHENTDSESKRSQNVMIVIDSFESKVIKIKVSKKTDKLGENLLDDKDSEKESASGGIWNSLNNLVGGGGSGSAGDETQEKKDNVLNIFSLASGHMYERLLRIMMLTVLKNTQARVKFWFLKNYLSPQFTKFLPYYAKEYGFDYELVQYKWPRWLHHESEKQRIIWGYKILFLDVLFPLSVDKIIYVDADQIVKADMTELRDLDLKGAPYGYVPFCDSRKEMDGYRFWKTGYWQMHLGNRKYHISALYVVDLKKFRKIAAGDRLRGQYQGLSQDPNSLSNLDQDLPNNMIHQVNIFSLPQEWLYCDTWCSSDTLSKAKTIDLCNNPQTKEPKLKSAQRIFPQWKDFDNEVRTLYQKWQASEQKNQSSKGIPIQTATSSSASTVPSSSTTEQAKVEL